MDQPPSLDALETTHHFPGVYQIKAIGSADDDFERRVVEAVVAQLSGPSEVDTRVRTTPGGRHVALTLEVQVQSAEHVRAIYASIRRVEGLTLLL